MDLYLQGATPLGTGQREQNQWTLSTASLEIWNKIRNADPEAKAGMYQKLAIATALAPPGSGNRGAGMAKTPGDPVDRYKHFKSASIKKEMFPSFVRLAVWEYERVVSSPAIQAAAPEMQAEAEANGSVKAAPKTPPTAAPASTPEVPFPVVPGVIHVEAETFVNSYAEPAHPDEQKGRVFVYDCFTGGKQVNFQRNMTISWVDYTVDVPASGIHELTVRTATPNFEQILDIQSGEAKLATINIPNTTGLWRTTPPVDIKLEKGKQTLRISAPLQRGIAIRWFELKAK